MKILNFLTALLPLIGRDDVVEDCRITRNEIEGITMPAYTHALSVFRGYKFSSDSIAHYNEIFGHHVKNRGRDNMIVTIEGGWKAILENLSDMEESVLKTFNEDIAAQGMTYSKANVLQFIELTGFVSKYARKLLAYVYMNETAAHGGDVTDDEGFAPAERSWLEANFIHFCTAFNIVSGNPQQVRTQMSNIPEIVVTPENVKTLPSTVGVTRMDPFNMGLVPLWLNPFYHIGMRRAEWQSARYKAAQAEKQGLELRKMNLEKLLAGKPDAALQRQLNHTQTRINDLNFFLAKMEKDNA